MTGSVDVAAGTADESWAAHFGYSGDAELSRASGSFGECVTSILLDVSLYNSADEKYLNAVKIR